MEFSIEGLEAAIAESNKPALDVGLHIAIVTGVEQKIGATGSSIGFDWKLNVNKSLAVNEWDADSRSIPLNYYTWLGDLVDEKVVYRNGQIGFGTVNILKSLNVSGSSFNVSELIGRALLVDIIHEPSQNDPETLFAKVKTTRKFVFGGEIAPKLFDVAAPASADASNSDLPF